MGGTSSSLKGMAGEAEAAGCATPLRDVLGEADAAGFAALLGDAVLEASCEEGCVKELEADGPQIATSQGLKRAF